jgi:hypothetical protein
LKIALRIEVGWVSMSRVGSVSSHVGWVLGWAPMSRVSNSVSVSSKVGWVSG